MCRQTEDASSSTSETDIDRMYSSIQQDRCIDISSGQPYGSIAVNAPLIGSADNLLSKNRTQVSVLGQCHLKQIQDVYESRSRLNKEQNAI